MKEIQFRGINKLTNEWVFGYYVFCRGRHYILQDYNSNGYDERWETSDWIEIEEKSLSQFTGLFDKNKIKIFTKDIVKIIRHDQTEIPYYFEVIYNQRKCCFELINVKHCSTNNLSSSHTYIGGNWEIVGTSFNVKELLDL